MNIFEVIVGWRYIRADIELRPMDWRFWVYRMWYDGPHTAIHMGPFIFSWGAEQ